MDERQAGSAKSVVSLNVHSVHAWVLAATQHVSIAIFLAAVNAGVAVHLMAIVCPAILN